MKFKILLSVLILIGFLSCKKSSDLQISKKLKSYTAYLTHTVQPSQIQTFIADQKVYDESGRLISSTTGNIIYDISDFYLTTAYSYKDGLLSETNDGYLRKQYLYQNNLLSETDIYYGSKAGFQVGMIQSVEVYSYDSQNRKIKTMIYKALDRTTLIALYSFEYNANNLISKQIISGGNTTLYEYNDDKLLIKQTESGQITFWEYDGHKNLTKVYYATVSNPNATFGKESYSYTYDNTGNITEIIQSDYNGFLYKIVINYDKQGKVQTKNVLTYVSGGYGPMSTLQYNYDYF